MGAADRQFAEMEFGVIQQMRLGKCLFGFDSQEVGFIVAAGDGFLQHHAEVGVLLWMHLLFHRPIGAMVTQPAGVFFFYNRRPL